MEPGPSRGELIAKRGHQLYQSLDQVKGQWDVISLSHCLEHVVDPVGFLSRLKTLLVPGGLIFCEVPNDGPGGPSARSADEPHVVFFSQIGLSRCGERAHLETLMNVTVGPKRSRKHLSFRDGVILLGHSVLPSSAVQRIHWTFQEGNDRVWIRAIFRVGERESLLEGGAE